MSLVACPFCHELFEQSEAKDCPVCGVALAPLAKVPLSLDAQAEDDKPHEPLFEPLPFAFLGRMRGPLAALSAAGFALFFLPWIEMTIPDITKFSGLDLARRLGWSWASGVAWAVLLPTVVSRRSIIQMRGARVAAGFLSAIPGVTVGLLLLRPPHASHGVHVRYAFGWPLYATLALSVVSVAISVAFGGRTDDIRVRAGSGRGEVLH